MTEVTESVPALLRQAADHLEVLDRTATTAQDGWLGYSDCPAEQPRGQIFAGPKDEHGYRTGSV